MRVYFNASVSARDEFDADYRKIVKVVQDLGNEVLADHVLDCPPDRLEKETDESRKKYYHKMIRRIKSSDLMVAEISYPSTIHVGHEMTLAMELNKPVLALHKSNRKPILFWGVEADKLLVEEYDYDNCDKVIKSAIDYLSNQMDTRFNFFVAPKHQHYLDWIAKHKRVPRAVYLRKLIEKTMAEDAEYLAE